jgi:PIN domain nuclease of toxin-antitoxin system
VAEFPAAVCDTNALLWHTAGRESRLGRLAAAHFVKSDRQLALSYVPVAVIWETTVLARAGHVVLRRPVREFFDDLFSDPCYQPVDLTPAQVYDADDLRFAKDPFDAMICACARALDLPLITRDTAIEQAKVVRTLW